MKIQRFTVMTLTLLVFTFLFWGWLFGFPWEKIQGIIEVKKYVKEKYDLTITDVKISFSIKGMDSALVSVEELPFSFQVNILRDTKQVWGDFYLDSLIKFKLEEFIRDKVDLLGDDAKCRVVLENRFTDKYQHFTVEDVNDNPNILLESPEITYFCSIDGIRVGTQRSFLIFKEVTENFSSAYCFKR